MASGYIHIYDISSRMQHVSFSSSTKPTAAQVETFIDEVEAEMDARMNAVGVEVPVLDSDKVKVLSRIAVTGVIAEVLRAVNIEGEDAANYQQMYEAGMRAIEKNPAIVEETSIVEPTIGGYVSDARTYRRSERVW